MDEARTTFVISSLTLCPSRSHRRQVIADTAVPQTRFCRRQGSKQHPDRSREYCPYICFQISKFRGYFQRVESRSTLRNIESAINLCLLIFRCCQFVPVREDDQVRILLRLAHRLDIFRIVGDKVERIGGIRGRTESVRRNHTMFSRTWSYLIQIGP